MEIDDLMYWKTFMLWFPPILLLILNYYSYLPKSLTYSGLLVSLFIWMFLCTLIFFVNDWGISQTNQFICEDAHFPVIRNDWFESDGIMWFRDGIDASMLNQVPINGMVFGVYKDTCVIIGANVAANVKKVKVDVSRLPYNSREMLVSKGWNLENIWMGVPLTYFRTRADMAMNIDILYQQLRDAELIILKYADILNGLGYVVEGEIAKSARNMAMAREVVKDKTVLEKAAEAIGLGPENPPG